MMDVTMNKTNKAVRICRFVVHTGTQHVATNKNFDI